MGKYDKNIPMRVSKNFWIFLKTQKELKFPNSFVIQKVQSAIESRFMGSVLTWSESWLRTHVILKALIPLVKGFGLLAGRCWTRKVEEVTPWTSYAAPHHAKANRVEIETWTHDSHQKTTKDPRTNKERTLKDTMEGLNQWVGSQVSLSMLCIRVTEKILGIWSWKHDPILFSTFAFLQCFPTSKSRL